jgi:uncharacterized Zn finger protein
MSWDQSEAQENQQRLEREMERRRQRGETFEVLQAPPGSKKLCTRFWGQAWCRHLESFQVYEARLPRGRSYLRQGKVYNLEIQPGLVRAEVAGAALYETTLHIQPLSKPRWQAIVEAGAGQVDSMLDLLAGKLGDGLLRLLIDPEQGLFPKPGEIRFHCSCPDYADLCKHASAMLYGVGVLLETRPDLLFTLRGVDQAELLATANASAISGLSASHDELAGTDLATLFGIDLHEEAPASAKPPP